MRCAFVELIVEHIVADTPFCCTRLFDTELIVCNMVETSLQHVCNTSDLSASFDHQLTNCGLRLSKKQQ